jgi:L-lysine exporter family protein LysE/ArgO
MMTAYFSGLSLGFGSILAIGAQNAFVLRQGLRREHVFAICLVCALSDAALIAFGVSSFRLLVLAYPMLIEAMRYAGAAFLVVYGLRSGWAALVSRDTLEAAGDQAVSLGRALATCLAFTWLNPHVYLDTVVLLGSISTQFPDGKLGFALGAMSASVSFFFSLGYGARLLRPLFASALSWRLLNGATAAIMLTIAGRLLLMA